MNRPIKFRGKPIQMVLPNGEYLLGDFVFGNLLVHKNGTHRILVPIDGGFENFAIAPSTLGQFTGLYDKNGKEIYEGDIILYGGSIQHEVVFRHGAFGYLIYGGAFISYAGNTNFTFNPLNRSKKHEVIGNIYDNPELLKGGEK